MESKKDKGDVVLAPRWAVEGEPEHNQVGEKRKSLEDC
jgi:hypothetical protein